MRGIAHFLTAFTPLSRRMAIAARPSERVRPSARLPVSRAANAGSTQVFFVARERSVNELPRKFRLLLLGSLALVAALQSADPGSVTTRLVMALESRFPRASIGDGRSFTGVVVLGGGEERLREAGRLARAHDHLKVFVSGAGEMSDVRRHLGLDIAADRIDIENRSRNTFENAQLSKSRVQPQPGERWLLVTSATHMPRAMGAFRSARFEVESWPVYDLPGGDHAAAGVLQHEALGLLWYWALGRSKALFPWP